MAITDQRATILQIINEVREKVKLDVVTTITADSQSLVSLKYLNDVIDEISDFSDWQETLVEFTVTAQSSVASYTLSTNLNAQVSATVIQNINEVVYSDNISEMFMIPLSDMRRLQRVGNTGTPRQWCVNGIDAMGNPKILVYPIPVSGQAGEVFTINAYIKPPVYVTADTGTIPPFPASLITQGLHACIVLDESDGEQSQRYASIRKTFEDALEQTYNRYNGDSGGDTFFRPAKGRR